MRVHEMGILSTRRDIYNMMYEDSRVLQHNNILVVFQISGF